MASTTSVTALYEDIVADLIPFYDNFVLLPNQQLIVNSYNIAGGTGNQMNIPTVNSWTTGSVVSPGAAIVDIAGDGQADPVNDFAPASVSLSVSKRASGTLVNMEDFEDGGIDTVRNAVVTRLARAIAQSTDKAGFNVLGAGSETVMTDLGDVTTIGMDGLASGDNKGDCELAYVMSPEALAYAVKRSPEVKFFENVNHDRAEYTSTVRNGFARIRPEFIRGIATKEGIGGATDGATLDFFSTSVANLRSANAPTDGAGFYAAVVSPAQELALAKQLNGVGGISSGSIGSVAQDMANDALLRSLITQALGCSFIRSNNLPSGLASA
jgi:hypothetical protein